MAYRITLELGDSSCLRAKKTPEGYTHDWEVFVRGVDNAPIHHYIEKVVFNLHETFQKPKRIIKEPPYVVKESGYAGFDIPIHIFFKNKKEPKMVEISYNLNLEQSGPAVSHVSHHNEIFRHPPDEFRKKLLKGGATPISDSASESAPEKSKVKTLPMVGKPKLSGNDGKKHRIPEQKLTNSFMDIFGDPVKTAKVPLEKKPIEKSVISKTTLPVPEKSEKIDKSTKPKHSPHKDSKKDKSLEEKKEKRDKEKDAVRDKDKIKEKSKRSSSPSSNKVSHHSSESKRPSSPMLMKKPITPPPITKRPSSPSSKLKEKERKITEPEKEKERSKDSSKSTSDESKSDKSERESKSERKKDKKKHKEDRDKEKKEKHKDKERDKSRDKESVKSAEKKIEKFEKPETNKLLEVKHSKEERKSPKPIVKEIEKVKEEKIVKPEKTEKHKESKSEKSDKSKHKHKKREKKDKRDGSREREKKEKREKSKSSIEKHNEVTNHTSTSSAPLIVTEPQSRDSSDSGSEDDDAVSKNRTPNPVKKESVSPSPPPPEPLRSMSPPPPPVSDPKKDRSDKKREKSKSSREDKEKKKKRKSESKGLDDEISPKKIKAERDHSTSPLVEPVSSSQSPIAANLEALHSKLKHEPPGMAMDTEPATGDSEQVAPDSTNSTLVDTEEPPIFSEDYVSQLKDLQQKIMTLQDNQELQRVVQVIAETGQYEITKKTFDFDLCALDRRTVARLQQFFAS